MNLSTRLLNRLLVIAVFCSGGIAAGQFSTVINVPPLTAPATVGSDVQINVADGGFLPDGFIAGNPDGSSSNIQVNVTGGGIGFDFRSHAGSTVNVSGGTVFMGFLAGPGSDVTVSGGEFLEGAQFDGPGDVIVSGGLFNPGFGVSNGRRTVLSGGSVLDSFSVFDGASALVAGATLGRNGAVSNATLDITRGTIGDDLIAQSNATINVRGGSIGDGFLLESSTLNLRGGSVGTRFEAGFASEVNILGEAFFLNAASIPGLSAPGDSIVLAERGGESLTGVLADGQAFGFQLNPGFVSDESTFSPDTTVRLTLVPEPGSLVLGWVVAACWLPSVRGSHGIVT